MNNINFTNLINDGTSNVIMMMVNCSMNITNSFISRVLSTVLLTYLCDINILNTIFLDNWGGNETFSNKLSLQQETRFLIINSSFISSYDGTNSGAVNKQNLITIIIIKI